MVTYPRYAVAFALAVLLIAAGSATIPSGDSARAGPQPVVSSLGFGATFGAPYSEVTVALLITANEPGIAAWAAEVSYDPAALTATGCTSHFGYCNATFAPDTVRFTGALLSPILGADLILGQITFATGPTEGQAQLTVTDYELYNAQTTAAESVTPGVGIVTLTAPPHIQGDINCSGAIATNDVTAYLAALSGLGPRSSAGCTPPGAEFRTHLWGDINCDRSANEADPLALLLHLSGDTIANGICPDIGSPLDWPPD